MRFIRQITSLSLLIIGVSMLPPQASVARPYSSPNAPLQPHLPEEIRAMLPQGTYFKASNTDANDQFGFSIASDGNTIVVGAPGEASNAVGINGNQSDNNAPNAGAAYVFVHDGNTWSQQAYLKASNTTIGDRFGYSVAIDGDTIVVGARFEDSGANTVNGNQADDSATDAGAAYVFVRNGTTWTQQAYLKASNSDPDDAFGYSVTISGDTIAVGAENEASTATGVGGDQNNNFMTHAGAVYVFTRTTDTWSQQAYVKSHAPHEWDFFGHDVALSGDTLAVGAHREDTAAINGGMIYIFARNGTTWAQQTFLIAPNPGFEYMFGFALDLDGDTLAVSSFYEGSQATGVDGDPFNTNAPKAGSAYVFVRSGTSWSQQAYLKASNTNTGDVFGHDVSISGDTIVVGARDEASAATGMDGDQANNNAPRAGAAYIFSRTGTTWGQQAYLKALNTETEDAFGFAVAISGETAFIAATGEDSAATNLNGNQTDNSASAAGAVYQIDTTPTYSLFLPYIQRPTPFEPIVINPSQIPTRPVVAQGETFYTTTITIPLGLPGFGTYYLSASPTSPEAALIDDKVIILAGDTEIFSYDYGNQNIVTPQLVEVPRTVLAPYAGQSLTVKFVDVYGYAVHATPLYLIWVP